MSIYTKFHTVLLQALSCCIIAITSYAQDPYQRQAIAPGTSGLQYVVHAHVDDSLATLLTNSGIMKLDINHGTIPHSELLSVDGHQIVIHDAHKEQNSLYILCSLGVLGGDTSCLMKYSLATNSFLWAKKIFTTPSFSTLTAITGDNNGNIYLAGTTYDTISQFNICVIKADTAGSILWSTYFGNSYDGASTPSIAYNNDKEIYLAYTSWQHSSPFGHANTIRFDSAGARLALNSIATASGSPRLSYCHVRIFNGKLCLLNKSIMGPSDPGPLLIRILDSAFNLVHQTQLTGINLCNLSIGSTTLLLSGQADIASGIPGFKTVRLDTALNITSGAHFDEIPTYSTASNSYSILLPGTDALHFFRHGSDTIHVVKTDSNEQSSCRYVPGIPLTTLGLLWYDTTSAISEIAFNTHTETIASNRLLATKVDISNFDPCSTLGIHIPQAVSEAMLYPNPVTTTLHLPAIVAQAAIYSIDGRLMKLKRDCKTIDVTPLPPGIYTISMKTATGNTFSRFSKL